MAGAGNTDGHKYFPRIEKTSNRTRTWGNEEKDYILQFEKGVLGVDNGLNQLLMWCFHLFPHLPDAKRIFSLNKGETKRLVVAQKYIGSQSCRKYSPFHTIARSQASRIESLLWGLPSNLGYFNNKQTSLLTEESALEIFHCSAMITCQNWFMSHLGTQS